MKRFIGARLPLLLALLIGLQPVVIVPSEASKGQTIAALFLATFIGHCASSCFYGITHVMSSIATKYFPHASRYFSGDSHESPLTDNSQESQLAGYMDPYKGAIHPVEPKNLACEFVGEFPREMKSLITQLKHPERYKENCIRVPKGFLLYGPPGCGKTYMVKGLAARLKIPLFAVTGSDFSKSLVGLAGEYVKALFKAADEYAAKDKSKTAIIFIDEFDSIGSRDSMDSGVGAQENSKTINALLAEMDGLQEKKDVNIIVIAATNYPEKIDPAIKRPGRINGLIPLSYPDEKLRLQMIFQYFWDINKKKEFHSTQDMLELTRALTLLSEGLDCASLRLLFDNAGHSMLENKHKKRSKNDFAAALIDMCESKAKTLALSKKQQMNVVEKKRLSPFLLDYAPEGMTESELTLANNLVVGKAVQIYPLAIATVQEMTKQEDMCKRIKIMRTLYDSVLCGIEGREDIDVLNGLMSHILRSPKTPRSITSCEDIQPKDITPQRVAEYMKLHYKEKAL